MKASHSPTAPHFSSCSMHSFQPFLLICRHSPSLLDWCDNPHAGPLSGRAAQRRCALPDVTGGVNGASRFSHKEPCAKKRGMWGKSVSMRLSNGGGEGASSCALLLRNHIVQFFSDYSCSAYPKTHKEFIIRKEWERCGDLIRLLDCNGEESVQESRGQRENTAENIRQRQNCYMLAPVKYVITCNCEQPVLYSKRRV